MSQVGDPLTAFIEMGRALLLAAGLAKCETGGSVYWSGGSGAQTIVLIHGVNDQAGTWGLVAGALARKHRLIVPDLAGHGESEPRTGPISMPLLVERLAAVIDAEGAKRVTLVGNSMGGWISMLYTLQHPERVERLVLESGAGLAIAPAIPLTANNRDEAIRILQAVHGPDVATAEWMIDAVLARTNDSQMIRVLQSGVFPHFVDGRLKELHVPTTVLWGEQDMVIPRPYVDKLIAGIPGARLKVIDQAAHIPHAQQPERFVECLMATF